MSETEEDPLILQMAKAMWEEDARVNGHDNRWEDMEESIQTLFKCYARVALERLNRAESASMT
jgi:hypothetical protein